MIRQQVASRKSVLLVKSAPGGDLPQNQVERRRKPGGPTWKTGDGTGISSRTPSRTSDPQFTERPIILTVLSTVKKR